MKMRKFAALMLTLCMMLSLSISAFAASDTIASGTIPDSKIKWELDSHGWLTISGSGEAPVFQSADDQPWVEYREQITEVWYDDTEAGQDTTKRSIAEQKAVRPAAIPVMSMLTMWIPMATANVTPAAQPFR